MQTKKLTDRLMWGLAIIAGFLTVTVLAQAGFGPGGPFNSEQFLERLQRDLDLTEEQSASARAFLDEAARQEEEILARYGLNRQQFQLLQKDLRMAGDGFFTRLRTVLTDEQKKEFKHHGEPEDGHRPPPPFMESAKPLGPAAEG